MFDYRKITLIQEKVSVYPEGRFPVNDRPYGGNPGRNNQPDRRGGDQLPRGRENSQSRERKPPREEEKGSDRLTDSGLFHFVDRSLIYPVFFNYAAVIDHNHPVHAAGDLVINHESEPLSRPHLLQTYPYVPVSLSTVAPVIEHASLLFSHWG